MPGLLLCFVMRYDNYIKRQALTPETESRITYFHCSLIGYLVGKFNIIVQCSFGYLYLKESFIPKIVYLWTKVVENPQVYHMFSLFFLVLGYQYQAFGVYMCRVKWCMCSIASFV